MEYIKKLFLFMTVVIFFTQTAVAQDGIAQRVTGYGKTRREALKDAYAYAVQSVVGAFISADVYIANGELIDDKIISHSEGYIERYSVISDYDGESITIEAVIRTKTLNDELVLYTKTKTDETGKVIKTEFDGTSILAKFDSQASRLKSGIELLEKKGEEYFNELLMTRNYLMIDSGHRKPYDNLDLYQFDITTNPSINKIRYASVIGKFGRLFAEVGADIQEWDKTKRLPSDTVVLMIDNSSKSYTFDKEMFKGVHELFYKFRALNNIKAAKINFKTEDGTIVHSENYKVAGTYFTEIDSMYPNSFIIANVTTDTASTVTVKVTRNVLEQMKILVLDYPDKELNKQIQDTKDRIVYETKFSKYGYNFFSVKVGLVSVVDQRDVDRASGGGLEFSKYYNDFPYIGVGVEFSKNENSNSNNTYKRRKDNIKVTDLCLKGIARYPVNPFEAYAAAGVSYIMIDVQIGDNQYENSFFNANVETGINVFFRKSMFAGLKYKYYQPFTDKYSFMDKIEGYVGMGF
ncbi:MAG: outer membrane beta-barrel protein [Deferribacteraceae bacterium]|jgi:hypothetical protein|nr:outer membrane beta-barrel protein [Deferribacteraceae bacterium]